MSNPKRGVSRATRMLQKLPPRVKKKNKKQAVDELVNKAGQGNINAVKQLLKPRHNKKALRVDKRNTKGGTALMEAAINGKVEMIMCLFEAKADVNAPSKKGVTALMCAAAAGKQSSVRCMLRLKAFPNVKTKDGSTALMATVHKMNLEMARLLIDAGASVDTKKRNGSTALSIAAQSGSVDLVKLLVQSGADVNCQTDNGSTPLMYASFYGHLELVRWLIEIAGANFELLGESNKTARSWAEYNRKNEVVHYLKYVEDEPISRWEKVRKLVKKNQRKENKRKHTKRDDGLGTNSTSSDEIGNTLVVQSCACAMM